MSDHFGSSRSFRCLTFISCWDQGDLTFRSGHFIVCFGSRGTWKVFFVFPQGFLLYILIVSPFLFLICFYLYSAFSNLTVWNGFCWHFGMKVGSILRFVMSSVKAYIPSFIGFSRNWLFAYFNTGRFSSEVAPCFYADLDAGSSSIFY